MKAMKKGKKGKFNHQPEADFALLSSRIDTDLKTRETKQEVKLLL
jgi:hypothetical protein